MNAREGSTNQIMKQHFQDIETLSDPEFNLYITSKQLKILNINKHYKFTHYNHTRFVNYRKKRFSNVKHSFLIICCLVCKY